MRHDTTIKKNELIPTMLLRQGLQDKLLIKWKRSYRILYSIIPLYKKCLYIDIYTLNISGRVHGSGDHSLSGQA